MVLISHHKNNNTSWQGYDNGSNKNDDNYNYDGCNVETRKIVQENDSQKNNGNINKVLDLCTGDTLQGTAYTFNKLLIRM